MVLVLLHNGVPQHNHGGILRYGKIYVFFVCLFLFIVYCLFELEP